MNEIQLFPKKNINGKLHVPPSKSYAQRVIALAGLSQNNIVIHNIGKSDDVIAARNIIQSLGTQFILDNDTLIVRKEIDTGESKNVAINCGESGLSTRVFSAFSLLYDSPFTINGEGSISSRTMEMVIEGLEQFGKKVESNHNKLPLIVSGKTNQNNRVEIDGSISSQFLTGLLIVAPFLTTDTEITVQDLKSKPYIEMTLDLLKRFGLNVTQKNYQSFFIEGNQEVVRPVEYTVEGDWSAASFLIVAGAIGGKIALSGLKKYSKQGDRRILEAVQQFGASIQWENNVLIVQKEEMKAFEFDASECPDLIPPLVVLASKTNGKSVIKGANRLKHKESDRAIVLQEECAKIGVKIELIENKMIIYGTGEIKIDKNTTFSSHNDHRIAMSMGLFSIGAEHPLKIQKFEAINKSYPNFFKDFSLI